MTDDLETFAPPPDGIVTGDEKPKKKPRKDSPTKRTLDKLRKEGALVEVVERWNMWSKTRHDLFGFIDVIAIRDGKFVAIQATSGANVSSRVEKTKASPNLPVWLAAGGIVEVWGWRLVGMKGKRKLWDVRIVPIELPRDV